MRGQCRTLVADVTIGCYYGDYSSCDNTISMSLSIWDNFFTSHLYYNQTLFLSIKILWDSFNTRPKSNGWQQCNPQTFSKN